jgi:hypothetical protein
MGREVLLADVRLDLDDQPGAGLAPGLIADERCADERPRSRERGQPDDRRGIGQDGLT